MIGVRGMPVARVYAGKELYRVHSSSENAIWYGRKNASWRWDAPNGDFGVMYLSRGPIGSFAETLLRTPGDRDVMWRSVMTKRSAVFAATKTLRLAKLHGDGLAWHGITLGQITSDPDPSLNDNRYADTQRITDYVYKQTDCDGIQYLSRFDSDEFCVALFERADVSIKLTSEGNPLDRTWVMTLLDRKGYNLIDL